MGREGGYGHDNTLRRGEGRGGSALKLKAASEFDSFWTSTLNKAQVGREGGKGHDNTLGGGKGRVSLP